MANIFKSIGKFFTGSPEKREPVSTLLPEQQGLFNQLTQAGMRPGAGGAFGNAADYYRNLLSDNSADFNAFAAPELRRYSQDIVPGLSEQFAGMGAGGLSSSGFRNAQIQGATDLTERLAAMRANLRQAGAAGLQNIGQLGLGNYSQMMTTQPGSEGFLSSLGPAIGTGLGTAIGGPIGGAIGDRIGNWFSNKSSGNQVGANTGPYQGGNVAASPQFQKTQLPGFLQGYGGYK